MPRRGGFAALWGALASVMVCAEAGAAQDAQASEGLTWLRYTCAVDAAPCPDEARLRARIEAERALPMGVEERVLSIDLVETPAGRLAQLWLAGQPGVRRLHFTDEDLEGQLDALCLAATLLLDGLDAPPTASAAEPAAPPPSVPASAPQLADAEKARAPGGGRGGRGDGGGEPGPRLWLDLSAGPAYGFVGKWGAAGRAGVELAWSRIALGASGWMTTNNRVSLLGTAIETQLVGGAVHGCVVLVAADAWPQARGCVGVDVAQLTAGVAGLGQASGARRLWYAPWASAELLAGLIDDRLHLRLAVAVGGTLRSERFVVLGLGMVDNSPLFGRAELGVRIALD